MWASFLRLHPRPKLLEFILRQHIVALHITEHMQPRGVLKELRVLKLEVAVRWVAAKIEEKRLECIASHF